MPKMIAAVAQELGEYPGIAVGIGPIEAALGTARLLEDEPPDLLVLVGSAGAYPGGPPIGRAVVGRRLTMAYGTATMSLGYVPGPAHSIVVPPELIALSELPAHDVVTVGAITQDPELASRLAQQGRVEHMETYAVARAAQRYGVPVVPILGIANHVGPNAHEEWVANRERAEKVAREAAQRLIATYAATRDRLAP